MSGRVAPSPDRTADGGRLALSRYDLLLAIVPAAFLLAIVLGSVAGVPTRVAVTAASVVAALAVVDGLFLNPPRRPRVGDGAA